MSFLVGPAKPFHFLAGRIDCLARFKVPTLERFVKFRIPDFPDADLGELVFAFINKTVHVSLARKVRNDRKYLQLGFRAAYQPAHMIFR